MNARPGEKSNMRRVFSLMLLLISAVPSAQCKTLQPGNGFLEREHVNAKQQRLKYLLFIPTGYDARNKYPLVLWLHGGGARGNDPKVILSWGERHGPLFFARADNQAAFPCIILAPQCPPGKVWSDPYSDEPLDQTSLALEILDRVQAEFAVDLSRLYLIGVSMGGYATWDIISRRPDKFAAAIPICGGGNPSKAQAMTQTAIWAFHGDEDGMVSVAESRKMIEAVKVAGGRPRYTEYKGVGHNSWEKAFMEPDFLSWIFSQRRK
jgi:predicted peptidase